MRLKFSYVSLIVGYVGVSYETVTNPVVIKNMLVAYNNVSIIFFLT